MYTFFLPPDLTERPGQPLITLGQNKRFGGFGPNSNRSTRDPSYLKYFVYAIGPIFKHKQTFIFIVDGFSVPKIAKFIWSSFNLGVPPPLLPTRAPGNAQIVGGWFKHLLREQHNSTHCYLAWTPSPTTATCKLPTLKWRPALTVCSICLNMLINLWQRCTIDAKSSGTNMVNVFRAVLIHNMLNKMFSFLSWWSSSSNKRRRQYD